jgi:hypothetical protein
MSHFNCETKITIEGNGKRWECVASHETWPAILEEMMYGLTGIGFFIVPEVFDAVNEATGNYETT